MWALEDLTWAWEFVWRLMKPAAAAGIQWSAGSENEEPDCTGYQYTLASALNSSMVFGWAWCSWDVMLGMGGG